MELRTTFDITPSANKITYIDPVIFIGSCFATAIGNKFETGHMPVMINPSGTVYNPVSVGNTLYKILSGKNYVKGDLYNNNGKWLSFDHYTDFSSVNPDKTLKSINLRLVEARKFIANARFLFVTFGTARVYRRKQTGEIVSNCHKIPAAYFSHELLKVRDIVSSWEKLLDILKSQYPDIKVTFTISPVRHWKDGAHGNQVSKSILFLAIEELLNHPSKPAYFPAYELVMDDLRDYRFYDDDMLHPSSTAVDYIWKAFSDCYFDVRTRELWKEVSGISKAVSHKIQSDSTGEIKEFAETILLRINKISKNNPSLNLNKEKRYFLNLLKI
jgi:hypothetical protein